MSVPNPHSVDGFDKPRHVKFWKRCATLLPDHYISADASRMSLGFFIVTALDLLGVLEEISEAERKGWSDWIYSCQVTAKVTVSDKDNSSTANPPDGIITGGFRGFSGTHLGLSRTSENQHWDPANLPNTYFALATLVILGDDLKRVQKDECLSWLGKLQLKDGSMGEFLGEGERIQGGRDLRLCCCAAGIAYILQSLSDADNNRSGERGREHAIDENRMVQFIASCQTYDGGFGQAPLLEAHSGLNYCAIAALSFLARSQQPPLPLDTYLQKVPVDISACLKWMFERQTTFIDIPDSDNDSSEDEDRDPRFKDEPPMAPDQSPAAGFNGRYGKMADTCYCFWTGAALDIVDKFRLVESMGLQKYLIGHTQHLVGGFGKTPGMPPDLLHSSLGLAALSITGYPGLKPVDSTMCISQDAASRLSQNTSVLDGVD